MCPIPASDTAVAGDDSQVCSIHVYCMHFCHCTWMVGNNVDTHALQPSDVHSSPLEIIREKTSSKPPLPNDKVQYSNILSQKTTPPASEESNSPLLTTKSVLIVAYFVTVYEFLGIYCMPFFWFCMAGSFRQRKISFQVQSDIVTSLVGTDRVRPKAKT